MFAVIRTGGKQYRVSPDDVIKIERLADVDAGKNVELTDVLAMGDGDSVTLGTPVVDGARVVASVLEHKRDAKVIVFKKKRRKNHRRTRGHRQNITVVRIDEILAAGQKASPKKKAAAKPAATADKKADEAPAKKPAAKKAPAKKAATADKPAAKKAPAKKAATADKPAAKKAPAKKAAAKKAPAQKATDDSNKE